MLWFDVEKRYNTTVGGITFDFDGLWFDVEKRYNTTTHQLLACGLGCGLM